MKNYFPIICLLCCLVVISMTGQTLAATGTAVNRGKMASGMESGKLTDSPSKAGATYSNKASSEYELGRTSKNAQERAEHLRRAEEFAKQAIKVDPQGAEGYKWLAIAIGAQAEDADVSTQIRISRQVKENIEKALSLDPDDDISLLVLSRWHYKIASLQPWTKALVRLVYGALPDASMAKAEELLLRAIAKKDRISHRYSLAKVYYNMGRRSAALEQLRLALTLPVTFPEEADDLVKVRKKLVSWK